MTPDTAHELQTLVLSRHAAIAVETSEEERLDRELAAAAQALGIAVFEWTLTRGLVRQPGGGAIYGTRDPAQMLANIGELSVQALFVLKDFAPALADPALRRAFRERIEAFAESPQLTSFVIVGPAVELPAEIEPSVVRYELRLPGPEEYRQVIGEVIESLGVGGRATVELTAEDRVALAGALSGLTLEQARQAVAQVAVEDGRLGAEDVARLGALKAQTLREHSLLEYSPPPDDGAELGGFAGLEAWLDRAQVAMSEEAASLGLPAPRGVLFVGVQGCGKSLAAKVIARRWREPLLKLDAGRLYDKYVGESERNLRRALSAAEAMAPAVLWIDEIEKGFSPAGDGEADGGVSRRLFGTLLTWMQEKRSATFVVATANDLSALPPELLRKGRFDEVFFVDLPQSDERAAILAIHLRQRRQDPAAFDLGPVAAATDGFSGAELESVVTGALLRALAAHRPLDGALLLEAAGATVPLSRSRREDIERLRATARERFVPVR